MRTSPFLIPILLLTAVVSSHAGSATWNLNPTNGNWNTVANWTPATVPNGSGDTATFALSNRTAVAITANTEVNSIVFNPGANDFTTTLKSLVSGQTVGLTISGAGIVNNSGTIQNFVTEALGLKLVSVNFTSEATAGDGNIFTIKTNPLAGILGTFIRFYGGSSAGNSTFVLGPFNSGGSGAGSIEFNDNSTGGTATFVNMGFIDIAGNATAGDGTFINDANSSGGPGGLMDIGSTANAGNATFTLATQSRINIYGTATNGTFTCYGSDLSGYFGGSINFFGNATAANAYFTLEGGAVSGGVGGGVAFGDSTTAENATIISEGGAVSGALGAGVGFFGSDSGSDDGGASAGNATITANGAAVSGATGASINFDSRANGRNTCTAANATLIANEGTNGGDGGSIALYNNSDGGTARVEVFGNATLDVSLRLTVTNVTIGSLEGDGIVFLGSTKFKVGISNLDTTFSGIIQEEGGLGTGHGGSFSKGGTGRLALTGASTYTGGTTLDAGTLVVNNRSGSATGTGPVQMNAGTLGGRGIISGAVTVGTGTGLGAFLAPGEGAGRQITLTIQSALTFKADATYTYRLNTKKAKSDRVIAHGVTVDSGAVFSFVGIGNRTLPPGTVLTAISNTATTPINGTFSNLPDGSTFTVGSNSFQANYEGGDGNDLMLTVVP